MSLPAYIHPLQHADDPIPAVFTFPFCYEAHPLCQRAADVVRDYVRGLQLREGKMFGVLVVRTDTAISSDPPQLAFMAAYSGQLDGSYSHPWFVPPVVDYLSPSGLFMQGQRQLDILSEQIAAEQSSPERQAAEQTLRTLTESRQQAVAEAHAVYAAGKAQRDALRAAGVELTDSHIRQSQQQKADVRRARHLFEADIEAAKAQLSASDQRVALLKTTRREESEHLQQWLFDQFSFSNALGTKATLRQLFATASAIPSGAGECCAPKLLQAAYALKLTPLAMAEFWCGAPSREGDRHEGVFYSACQRKCRPILRHMLTGLNVAPDPSAHYNKASTLPRVIYEDAWLAVMHKPAGWLSVPGKAEIPNMVDEAHRLWPDLTGSAVVHRLDQDTSGLLVVAKTNIVHRAMQHAFAHREVEKRYVALLSGDWSTAHQPPLPLQGTVSLPLAPCNDDLPRQRVDHVHGDSALTHYEVVGTEPAPYSETSAQVVTRVLFSPTTGRTHQLRVHSASAEGLAMPILGDRLYGHIGKRLYLHAESLSFIHPVTRERLTFTDKCPF